MKLLTSEWVTPDFDKSVSFELRGMNGMEYLEYSSYSFGKKPDKKGRITFDPEQSKVALRAVSGWKGVMDGNEPAVFSQEALQERADLQTIAWLLTEIVTRSTVDADAEKN